jgi:transcriptional/translational regulatory protein YebC/TACO1
VEQVLRLMEALEEHDDVQNVYANFDIDEKELAAFNQ